MKPVVALSLALACAAPAVPALAQGQTQTQGQAQTSATANTATPAAGADPVAALVGQLDLEKYKATIKSLTRFGDRRQGTERNRQALDWIEAQLKSYGCSNTERLQYQYTQAAPGDPAPKRAPGIPSGGAGGPPGHEMRLAWRFSVFVSCV